MRELGNAAPAPRLLVVQPDPQDQLYRFERWLSDAGLAARLIRPFTGEEVPDHLEEDGLVVLGGKMSVHDDDESPWLADIRRLLRDAVERSRPCLGICLGGQILADAFGGKVTVGNRGLECGVIRVRWHAAAQTDPLAAGLPTPFLTGAMHSDMIETLPNEAVWLASSDMYPYQAFRIGPLAWGLQFHPEVSAATYREWVAASHRRERTSLARLRQGLEEFPRLDDKVKAGTSSMARRFADLVYGAAAPGTEAQAMRRSTLA